MHWHPNADEWAYFIKGSARMTVFNTGPAAITADFHARDVSYVPKGLGHYVENTGNTDLVFMEVFRTDRFQEVLLSVGWRIAHWRHHSSPRPTPPTL
jgi:oxalate decarboxylase